MHRNFVTLAALLLGCTLGGTLALTALSNPSSSREITPKQTSQAPINARFQPLIHTIQAQMKAQQVPGLAVAIVQNGGVIFQQGFGVRNTETHDPVTTKTLFRIGSTTKPLTAIGLMRLVEARRVELDQPVARYLPEFKVNATITVRQLLSHTSGLADFVEPHGRTDANALREAIASLTPDSAFAPPGQVLSYSNPGFNVAGRIIETVSGMSYPEYMKEFVFAKLGMTRTTFNPGVAITYPVAVGYQPGSQALEAVRPTPDNAVQYPSGFAFSSVEDLSRLMLFLLQNGQLSGKSLLSSESVQAMKTPILSHAPFNTGYGLGLETMQAGGITLIGHNGAIYGYTADLKIFPEQDFGIVILANKSGFDPASIFEIVKQSLLNRPKVSSQPPMHLNASALKAYTGKYRLATADGNAPQILAITLKDGQLKGNVAGQPEVSLQPLRSDVFQLKIAGQTIGEVGFLRDQSGQVVYFSQGLRAYPRLRP